MLLGKIYELHHDAKVGIKYRDSRTVQRLFDRIYERLPQEYWPSSYMHMSKLSDWHFTKALYDIDYDTDLDSDSI